MKIITTGVMITGFVLFGLVSGCSKKSDEQKVADAKAEVVDATQNVVEAINHEEWVRFKTESETKITNNDRIIAEYKTKMTMTSGKLRAKYDKKIDELELKNKTLKTKLSEYKESGKSAWEQFKGEYNRDIDELGLALNAFVVDNKK